MLYKNLFKLVLKTLMLVKRVRLGGSTFQSFAAFIMKLSSNLVSVAPFIFRKGFKIALMADVLGCSLKIRFTLFGVVLFKIFHVCIRIVFSLRLCSDIILSF